MEVEEVEESNKVAGLSVALRPEREPKAVRFTFPEKPFSEVIVMRDVPEEPAWMVRETGLAAIVIPVTSTLTCAEPEIGPVIPVPVPMTVTV